MPKAGEGGFLGRLRRASSVVRGSIERVEALDVGDPQTELHRLTRLEIDVERFAATRGVELAVFSADGTRALTSDSPAGADVWDVASGKRLRAIDARKHASSIDSAALTHDGDRALLGLGDGTVIELAVADGALTGRFRASQPAHRSARCVAYAPAGDRVVAAFDDGEIALWDRKGASIRRFGPAPEVPEHSPRALAFSSDGAALLVERAGGAVELWDTGSGTLRFESSAGTDPIIAGFFVKPDSVRWATRSGAVWEQTEGGTAWRLAPPSPGPGWEAAFFASEGGAVLLKGPEGNGPAPMRLVTIGVEDAGQHLRWAELLETKKPLSFGFSPSGALLAAVMPLETIHLFASPDAKQLQIPGKAVLAFSADGARVAVRARDDSIAIHETTKGRVVARVPARAQHVAFSPDESLLITAEGGLVIAWSIEGEVGREKVRATYRAPIARVGSSMEALLIVSTLWRPRFVDVWHEIDRPAFRIDAPGPWQLTADERLLVARGERLERVDLATGAVEAELGPAVPERIAHASDVVSEPLAWSIGGERFVPIASGRRSTASSLFGEHLAAPWSRPVVLDLATGSALTTARERYELLPSDQRFSWPEVIRAIRLEERSLLVLTSHGVIHRIARGPAGTLEAPGDQLASAAQAFAPSDAWSSRASWQLTARLAARWSDLVESTAPISHPTASKDGAIVRARMRWDVLAERREAILSRSAPVPTVVVLARAIAFPREAGGAPERGDRRLAILLEALLRMRGLPVLGTASFEPPLSLDAKRRPLPDASDAVAAAKDTNAGLVLAVSVLLRPDAQAWPYEVSFGALDTKAKRWVSQLDLTGSAPAGADLAGPLERAIDSPEVARAIDRVLVEAIDSLDPYPD